MSWYSNINKLFIVEDQMYSTTGVSLVLPESLKTTEAEGLKDYFQKISADASSLWDKIVESIDQDIVDEFLDYVRNNPDNSFEKLESWYLNDGKKKWQHIISCIGLNDEYIFLNDSPIKFLNFTSYESAISYINSHDISCEKDKFNLWLLDREFNSTRMDLQIINLLELLSRRENSIGIIYSAKIEDIDSRSKIFTHLETIINTNSPKQTEVMAELKEFAAKLKGKYPKSLFLDSDTFINELYLSFDQVYRSKAHLNNLVWVIAKSSPIPDTIEDRIKNASYGFSLYKLLNLYVSEKKSSLGDGMCDTSQLEIESILDLKNKSIYEGSNISDTLLRIQDINTNCSFYNKLSANEKYLNILRSIESWEQDALPKQTLLNFNKLLTEERFDYKVSSLFRPIMTGDIFEFDSKPNNTSKSNKEYYMLLTQECDCIARKPNKDKDEINRKVKIATLISLSRKNLTHEMDVNITDIFDELKERLATDVNKEELNQYLKEISESCRQCAASNFEASDAPPAKLIMAPFLQDDGNYVKFYAQIRQTIHVDFKLLDLCMLNSEGKSMLPRGKDNIDNVKKDVVSLYPKYYQRHLIDLIDSLTITVENVLNSNGTDSTFKEKTDLQKHNVENFVLDTNSFNYQIKRVARLNMPHRAFIHAYYGLTQSNIGLTMEL